MTKLFKCIGILGQPRLPHVISTHRSLYQWLISEGYQLLVEQHIAQELNLPGVRAASLQQIGEQADLALVIGGDGNMLGAARVLACYPIKVIGVNRGNLGFLTDLDPDNAQQQLQHVLEGYYTTEQRFLLSARIENQGHVRCESSALNEVVLHPGKVAHMIEFDVWIDDHFAFSQRADGLIISTPTGSTAYSLSAGGPIVSPHLEAIVLVPMFPHTLTARPLVIGSDSQIRIRFTHLLSDLEVNCDGQLTLDIQQGDEIIIARSHKQLTLIHPESYGYFTTLSRKLGWSKKLF